MLSLMLPRNLMRSPCESASRPVWLTSPIATRGARMCCGSPPRTATISSKRKGGKTCWLGSESYRIIVTQTRRCVLKTKLISSVIHCRVLLFTAVGKIDKFRPGSTVVFKEWHHHTHNSRLNQSLSLNKSQSRQDEEDYCSFLFFFKTPNKSKQYIIE